MILGQSLRRKLPFTRLSPRTTHRLLSINFIIGHKKAFCLNWKHCPLLGRSNDEDVVMSIEDTGTNGLFGWRRRSRPVTSRSTTQRKQNNVNSKKKLGRRDDSARAKWKTFTGNLIIKSYGRLIMPTNSLVGHFYWRDLFKQRENTVNDLSQNGRLRHWLLYYKWIRSMRVHKKGALSW